MDIRRIDSVKQGDKVIGNKVKVKLVKNKMAPPLTQCEFEIMYGEGVPKESALIDSAVPLNIIEKSGSWYSFNGTKLGQGKEKVKDFLKENPEIFEEIDVLVRNQAFNL